MLVGTSLLKLVAGPLFFRAHHTDRAAQQAISSSYYIFKLTIVTIGTFRNVNVV